jgi:8-oxo-dGTP pyrophosphatase MutT (NUDIX family)
MWLPSFIRNRYFPSPPEVTTLTDAQLTGTIIKAVGERPDSTRVAAALLVRLMNQQHTTMTGAQYIDTLPGADPAQPLAAYVYPFAQITGGAGSAVIGADGKGETCVLLARNHGQDYWCLPAGYMKPRGPFSRQKKYVRDTERRDAYDTELLKSGNAPPLDTAINTLTDTPPSYDKNLEATARRELEEETGLRMNGVQAELLYRETINRERPCPQGPQPEQQHDEFFLFDIRSLKTLPPVRPGDDVEETRWVKLSDIRQQGSDTVADGRKIGVMEAKVVAEALHHIRSREIKAYGVTIDKVRSFCTTPRPETEFGPQAAAWHANALGVAGIMQRKMEELKASPLQERRL